MQTYIAGLQHLRISQPQVTRSAPPAPVWQQLPANFPSSGLQGKADTLPALLESQPQHEDLTTDLHLPDSRRDIPQVAVQTGLQQSNVDTAWQQGSIGKNVYISLAPHNGSAVDAFLSGLADPSEWEVYVWQAPAAAVPTMEEAKCQEVIKQWKGEVSDLVTFPEAAGMRQVQNVFCPCDPTGESTDVD